VRALLAQFWRIAYGLRGRWPRFFPAFTIMFDSNSVRLAPGLRSAVAAAATLTLSFGAVDCLADDELGPVVVSSSRTAQLLQIAPIGATVITSEQISRSGVADANEAIRKLGGVAAKSDLNNGREQTLDLRGYGDTASQNLVVLVDGLRISENEIASARLSAIPLDLIDRIEIVRGGASVLWGEGASAGVINVILKQGAAPGLSARLMTAVESFAGNEVLASGRLGLDHAVLDGSVKRVRSEGFRDNAEYKQDVQSLGWQWADQGWRAGLRAQHEDQWSGLPGSMSVQQLEARRRYSSATGDFSKVSESRYQGNVAMERGAWTAQLDGGWRERQIAYQYISYGSEAVLGSSRQTQFTPRLIHSDALGATRFKSVLGLDWQAWDFDKAGSGGLETGTQSNRAVFIHSDISWPTLTRLSLGAREERVRKQGAFPGDLYTSAVSYDRHDHLHAGELGLSQTVWTGWDLYGRLASSYRLANIDENRVTPSNGALLPQKNKDRELGLKWAQGGHSATVRAFSQTTVNEIVYVSSLYANANLDPTRRRGVEFEGRWQANKQLELMATWQQVSAKFREGSIYSGNEMVLVAPHSATVRASWRLDDRQTLEAGAQFLASMRSGEDASNLCTSRIPSSTLLDGRYAWSDKVWTVAVSGTNLADKKGYNYGYGYGCDGSGVYPFAGRSMKVSLARQF
jgi:iron complex outermembrane receptor protein